MPSARSSSESDSARFSRTGTVEYDLSSPPTAAQVGLPAGERSAAFNRDGTAYWRYRIALPDGRSFTTLGFGHVVTVDPPPTGLGNQLLVNTEAADLDAATTDLLRAAPVLGLDEEQIRRWEAQSKARPMTLADPLDNTVFRGSGLGYLTMDVQAMRSEDTPGVSLGWSFLWGQA